MIMEGVSKAVITGGTKGIGRAIAESMGKQGYELWVCARNKQDLDAMTEHWKAKYPGSILHTFPADVSEKGQVLQFADMIMKTTDSLDVLVNNAGIFFPGSVFEEPEGNLEKMIDTNLYSAYYLSRALIGLMLPQQSGHIFNICSIASITAYANGGSYAISKHAMLGLSKMQRTVLKDKGIKVTSVLPGATWSASWEGADFPNDRLMQAADVAESVMSALRMSPSAVVEEIIIRPQLGDL